MAKPFHPGLVSANDLATGRVIWRTADGRWADRPDAAQLITDPAEAEAALADAAADIAVVGVYLAPARPGPEGPEPAHLRETFRAAGPSAPARASWGEAHA